MTTSLGLRLGESSRVCNSCKRDLPLTHDYFYLRPARPGGFTYACKECMKARDKRNYPKRKKGEPRRGKHCHQCESLAHRRPKHALCACGERYAADPPMTLAEACEYKMDRTVMPSGGEGWS